MGDKGLNELVRLLKEKEEQTIADVAAKAQEDEVVMKEKADKRAKYVQLILDRKSTTFLEIAFYNALAVRDDSGEYIDPDAAVEIALEHQKELYGTLLEFNALLSGFQFLGLSMGEPPSTNIAVSWYFCIILGFGGNACAAFICMICILFVGGLKNEDPQLAITRYLRFGKFFFLAQLLSIGSTFCLVIGVNVMVHEFFNDVDDYPCAAKGSTTENANGIEIEDQNAETCGPVPVLAWILNAISVVMFAFIGSLWYFAIFANQGPRKITKLDDFKTTRSTTRQKTGSRGCQIVAADQVTVHSSQ